MADSPDLPRLAAVVHHRQDAAGGFQNRHSAFIPGTRSRWERAIKKGNWAIYFVLSETAGRLTSSFSS